MRTRLLLFVFAAFAGAACKTTAPPQQPTAPKVPSPPPTTGVTPARDSPDIDRPQPDSPVPPSQPM